MTTVAKVSGKKLFPSSILFSLHLTVSIHFQSQTICFFPNSDNCNVLEIFIAIIHLFLFVVERSDCFFHEKISENSKFIGSCRRGQIDGFIAADPFRILKFPPLSTKLLGQFNQDSDVLVFRTEIESNVALLVVDVLNSSLGFIDSGMDYAIFVILVLLVCLFSLC
jgi:hypothetical protein